MSCDQCYVHISVKSTTNEDKILNNLLLFFFSYPFLYYLDNS